MFAKSLYQDATNLFQNNKFEFLFFIKIKNCKINKAVNSQHMHFVNNIRKTFLSRFTVTMSSS